MWRPPARLVTVQVMHANVSRTMQKGLKISTVTDQQKLPLDLIIVFYLIFSCVCVCVFFFFYPVKKSQTNRDLVRHVLLKSLNTIGQDPGDVVKRPMTIFRPITLFYSSLIHSLVSLRSQVWISIETKKKMPPSNAVVESAHLLACH